MCTGNSPLEFFNRLQGYSTRPARPRRDPAPTRAQGAPLSAFERELVSKAYPIIKTAVRHLGSLVVSSGMDRNDAIQHIALVFVGRLQGPHPFNPSKGSLESYCRMLAKSVLINQKAKRIRRATGDVIFAGMQETT